MTPEEFGELIRSHREAKGLSVADLAARFKLSSNTIRSIEDGSLDNMPHMVYAKGFVRACAQAVDVSPEDLAEGLAVLFPEDQDDDSPVVPGPLGASVIRSHGLGGKAAGFIFALVFLALIGGAAWFFFASFDTVRDFAEEKVSIFSSSVNGPDSGEASAAQSAPEAAAPEQPVVASSASSTVRPASNVSADAAPAPVDSGTEGQQAAAPDAPAADAAAGPADSTAGSMPDAVADAPIVSGNHVGIRASEDCWVEAAVDNSRARQFTVQAGTYSVLPYKSKLVLVLGNAGGVTLTHNGKAYPLNGRRNERRTFTFQ